MFARVSLTSRTGAFSPTEIFSVRSGPTVDLKKIFLRGPAEDPETEAGVFACAGVLDREVKP